MKQHKKALALWIGSVLVLLVGALLAGSPGRTETVQEAMRDAVLHSVNRISLLGLKTVNPGMISAFVVTAALLLAAALIRVFVIPRFQYVPGKFQLVLEEAVGLFDRMSRGDSPHRCKFLGAYIFAAGAYIFVGTLFELLGIQAVTVHGHSITLPAPLSDVNAAIALGTLSYLVILSGQNAEGVFPAHLHELPAVRRSAQRPAGDRAGILLYQPQLCPARAGGRAVHPAPRPGADLRAHHAGVHVLRGGIRAGRAQTEKNSHRADII